MNKKSSKYADKNVKYEKYIKIIKHSIKNMKYLKRKIY